MNFKFLNFSENFSRSQDYLELEKGDDEGSETSSLQTQSRPNAHYRRSFILSSILNVVFTSVLFIILGFNAPLPWRKLDPKALIKTTSTYSPLFDELPLTTTTKRINGSFFSETDPPDIFRALPSKEVDAVWRPISKPTWITITESEARGLGKDPSLLVKAPETWGVGKGKYIAMLDLNHQLHCIDQLRKLAFQEDYPLRPARMDFQKEHWMHCVHILYQNVMCTGSTEIITYNWRETQQFPMPDFDVDKKCRNSEVLLDYQQREKIEGFDELREVMVKPEDAVTLPLPPRLKAFLDAHDD